MADFTTIKMECNTGNNGAPTWTSIATGGAGGANEVRWSDVSTQDGVGSAAWAATIRPAATALVNYAYAFTADAVGTGIIGTAGPPVTWARANYLWARWNWDAVGTFASAPIFTAYPSTAHANPTRNDGSWLGGSADTLNVSNFSYLKAAMWGRVTSAGAPGAAPGADPTVTSGAVGAVNPVAGANWSAWQDLMGGLDYLQFPSTPAATTADTLNLEFVPFMGPNLTPALYVIVMDFNYTWS